MDCVTAFDIHDWGRELDDKPPILLKKLMQFGMLPSEGTMHCPQDHSTPMRLVNDGDRWKWRCYHFTTISKKKGGGRKRCNYGVSLITGTFFAKTHLPLVTVCKFLSLWLDHIPLNTIGKQIRVSGCATLVDWAKFSRGVCFDDLVVRRKPIGGVGKIVEIDESKFGKRKYHRGKRVEGQWVFGAYDRETGESFMVPVDKRDSATLVPIIQNWILPGTTIISDCWKSYDCLKDTGYIHLQVNHSINFKDPETGAHTNSIEGSWAHAKRSIPAGGRRKNFMGGYLAHYMFTKRCNAQKLDRFAEFCRIAGKLYDPLDPVPEIVDESEDSEDEDEDD